MVQDVLLVFRMVEALVGVQIALVSFKIYRDRHPMAWQFLGYSGLILATWAVGSLYAHLNDPGIAFIIDGAGVPLFTVLLSASVLVFITRSFPIELPRYVSFGNGILYLGSIILLFSFMGIILYPTEMDKFFTFFYSSTLLLILPAIYGFHKIPQALQTQTWRYFVFTSVLIYSAVILNLYAAAFCGTGGSQIGMFYCASYAGAFASIYSVPLFAPVLVIATLAPAIMLTAVIFFGYGSTVMYYHLYQEAQAGFGGDTPVEQLVEGTVDNLGSIIGTPLARRIANNALDDIESVTVELTDDALTVTAESEDTGTFQEVKMALISGFQDTIGPVAKRKIEEVEEHIRGAE